MRTLALASAPVVNLKSRLVGRTRRAATGVRIFTVTLPTILCRPLSPRFQRPQDDKELLALTAILNSTTLGDLG